MIRPRYIAALPYLGAIGIVADATLIRLATDSSPKDRQAGRDCESLAVPCFGRLQLHYGHRTLRLRRHGPNLIVSKIRSSLQS
jgi:hypothetical protein